MCGSYGSSGDGFGGTKSSGGISGGFLANNGGGIRGGFGVKSGGETNGVNSVCGISNRFPTSLTELNSRSRGFRLSARRTDCGPPAQVRDSSPPTWVGVGVGVGGSGGRGVPRRRGDLSSEPAHLQALRSPFEAAAGGDGGGRVANGGGRGGGQGMVRSGGVMAARLRPLLDALDDARGVRATGAAAMQVNERRCMLLAVMDMFKNRDIDIKRLSGVSLFSDLFTL